MVDRSITDMLLNNTGQSPSDSTQNESPQEQWYRTVIAANPDKYDTGISKQQWLAWYPLWNSQTKKFKSVKVDENGNAFQQEEDKPTDCPSGLTAFGDDRCLPVDHPKVLGAGQNNPAAPAKQAPSTSGAPGDIQYTGNPMIDMLIYQFNTKRSLVTGQSNPFGLANGRTPGDQQPDITGKLLQGGGLWWGPAGMDMSLNPTTVAPTPAAPTTPPPQAPITPPPDVSTNPVNPPMTNPLEDGSMTESPLQRMLKGRIRNKGVFGSGFDLSMPVL